MKRFAWCLVLTLALPAGLSRAQAVVDFEGTFPRTSFSVSLGDNTGDLLFVQDGVEVRFLDAFRSVQGTGTIGGFSTSAFPTTPYTFSNTGLTFDVSNLPTPVTFATFEYADFGGDEIIGINGSRAGFRNFASAPATLGGVNLSVTPTGSGVGFDSGLVTLSGPITTLELGGQEFGVDNVTFLPEPASAALLGLGLLGLTRRRR